MMKKEQVLGLARHILTFGSGVVISKGYVDETTAIEIVGGLTGLLGLLWSIFDPSKKKGNGY